MMDNEELAALYLQTLVSIEDESGSLIPIQKSLHAGEVLYVITAWNPGDERPMQEENVAADSRLHSELVRRGLLPSRAIGADPSSNHYEEGWAVIGLDDQGARAIGASFGQVAVFRISDGMQTVLACREDWSLSRPL